MYYNSQLFCNKNFFSTFSQLFYCDLNPFGKNRGKDEILATEPKIKKSFLILPEKYSIYIHTLLGLILI